MRIVAHLHRLRPITMIRCPFSLLRSPVRRSRRVAFAGVCFLLLAAAAKPALAGSSDSNQLVRPLRVESTSGQVTNADAPIAGHNGFATLTWGGVGSAPTIVLDYGRDVGGLPVFVVSAVSGTPRLQAIYSEAKTQTPWQCSLG